MTFRNAAKRIIASIRHCHRTKTSYDVQVSANKIRWNNVRFFIPMWKVQVQQEEILILNMYRFKLRDQPQKNSRTKHTLVSDQLNILRQYLGKCINKSENKGKGNNMKFAFTTFRTINHISKYQET